MSRPAAPSGPAAGIVHGLIACAGIYGLLIGVAVAGGVSALLTCLVLVLALLHACLTGAGRSVTVETPAPALR